MSITDPNINSCSSREVCSRSIKKTHGKGFVRRVTDIPDFCPFFLRNQVSYHILDNQVTNTRRICSFAIKNNTVSGLPQMPNEEEWKEQ